MKIFDFIECTEEIFKGVKNTVGGETNSEYYLRYSQALSVYVKNCRQNPNHSFTPASISGFLNKCRYFIYPENRIESYKIDISVREFSERCVTVFFKRFGMNFSFLRINSDNKKFIEVQKKCLENLFEQIISIFHKYDVFEEKEFLNFLKMYYCRYRFDLYNTDMKCLFSNYDVLMRSELNDYVRYTTNAFHKLKSIYTRARHIYERDEYILEIRRHYQKNIKDIETVCEQVSDAMKSGVNNIEKFNMPEWSAISVYMLYKNNYSEVWKIFKEIYSEMVNIRNNNPKKYDEILSVELVKFECMLHKFLFYIIVQSLNAPEDDM